MNFKLTKEIDINGQTVNELSFDLDDLTPADLTHIKNRWTRAGGCAPMPMLDYDFAMRCVAAAMKVPFEDLHRNMRMKDYMRLAQEVVNFFMLED